MCIVTDFRGTFRLEPSKIDLDRQSSHKNLAAVQLGPSRAGSNLPEEQA